MSNFDLSSLALKAICPSNELLYDDKGMPSVMVKIPKMTYAQLGLGSSSDVHPAFIVNGQEVDAIYISKYQNVVQNGRAYSLPGQDPKANITFDAALAACTAKGEGWHLMTKMEWGLIADWCKHNGTLPYGNNNYGKDSRETAYKAIPSMAKDGEGRIQRVATGTGPLTWSHDRTLEGIWDLNGNVWEWNGGIRLVYGELQILANNNGADSTHSQAASGTEWKAIDGTNGQLITPNGSGTTANALKLDYISSKWTWIKGTISSKVDQSRGCAFESVSVEAGISAEAILLLQALGLYKYDNTSGAYEGDYWYSNNGVAERSFYSGGYWGSDAGAGVFFSYSYFPRSASGAHIGFRSAYVSLPTA